MIRINNNVWRIFLWMGDKANVKNDCLYVFAPYSGKRWDIGTYCMLKSNFKDYNDHSVLKYGIHTHRSQGSNDTCVFSF